MIVAYMPFVICLVGLLIWALTKQGILPEVGRLMFFAGLIVTCFSVAGNTTKFF